MSLVNHLNTEELLLSCDGELSPEHTAHLDGCDDCALRLATVTADLSEIEEALRSSVSANGRASNAAAWARLEREIRPNVVVFPLRRWVPAIGLAASLLVVAFVGNRYLNTSEEAAPASEIVATVQSEAPVPVVEPLASISSSPASAVLPSASPRIPAATPRVQLATAEVVIEQKSAPAEQALQRFGGIAAASLAAPSEVALASLGAHALELRAATETRNVWLGLPAVPPPSVTARELPAANLDSAQLAALVDAYSALTKAGLWQEDVRPLWSPSGLWISGSVENAEVRDRIAAALLKSGVNNFSFDVKLRSSDVRVSPDGSRANGLNPRPLGGIVRSALVSHFGDAARRSFQSPRPEALHSELDRYVTEIFKTESDLLAHAYALHTLVDNVDPHAAGEHAARQFDDMVAFHTAAMRDSEARIYDKLSEALPRRFWSYRSTEPGDALGGRREQAKALLADSLKLDQTLTALLGSQNSSIDAGEVNLSCGELLYKIRARVRQIQ